MNIHGLHEIKKIFQTAVNAAKPNVLINKMLELKADRLAVGGKSIQLDQNCYVIGFGKAVLGMALELDRVIHSHITSGILSIPVGSLRDQPLNRQFFDKFLIMEGAQDNVPDENALQAATKMQQLIKTLSKNDLLFVLISGGGSALLPSPIEGLSLAQKQEIIKLLSKHGANIQELNTVRKKLSNLKGGKLAQLSYPRTTISIILSDVIGNPLDTIASGPTAKSKDDETLAWEVIKKYNIEGAVPFNVQEQIKAPTEENFHFDHVINILIGTNDTALQAAKECADSLGYATVVLSSEIQGEAKWVAKYFAELSCILSEIMKQPNEQKHNEDLHSLVVKLGINPHLASELYKIASKCHAERKHLCVVSGGETVVKIKGKGRGGRNQEMCLAWAIEMESLNLAQGTDSLFLCAGTDGIDGPTDAAGAVAYSLLVNEAQQQNLHPESYLVDNDSYSFFQSLNNGLYHLIIGHTGTNVMDVHILLVTWK